MDKTYTETQGLAPFDWNKALDDALLNEPTPENAFALLKLARRWPTCAVGNMCAIIPRSQKDEGAGSGCPLDNNLSLLGCHFVAQVAARQWHLAKQTLSRIERRSAVLIREELAKLNDAIQLEPSPAE